MIHGVGVVGGMPRSSSHYNLGTSRGPEKRKNRVACPGRVLHVVDV